MLPYLLALLFLFSFVIPFLKKQEQKRLKERRDRRNRILKFGCDTIDDWEIIEPGNKSATSGQSNGDSEKLSEQDHNPFKPTDS